MFNSIAIANWFIERANRDDQPITAMKIQKLIYFAHGWHLAIAGTPLINEQVQAWKYGPVISNVYHQLKYGGSEPVMEMIDEIETARKSDGKLAFIRRTPTLDSCNIPSEQMVFVKSLLEKVWSEYGKLSAVQLSNLTHLPGSPWHSIWDPMKHNPINNSVIPADTIKTWFREQARSGN